MQFITIRDFRNRSAEIQKELLQQKEMVVTSNGKPIAILTATSAAEIEESLAMIRQARAMRAVDSLQRRSMEIGTGKINLKEVNREIAAVRKGRKPR